MNQLSIQTRVFIIALLPTLIISLLLGVYTISSRINDAERELSAYGQAILGHVVRISRNGVLKNDRQILQDITSLALEEKELESITFFGPDHELLAYSGSDDPQSLDYLKNVSFDNEKETIQSSKDSITFTAPIIMNNLNLETPSGYQKTAATHKTVIGWVAISLSRTQTVLQEYQVIIITMTFLSLGLLISVFLARRTARHLTRPLLRMRKAVKQLEQGKLATRIDTRSPGELGELEEGINHMASALQGAQDELQHNVEQATSSLKQSLETIELQNTDLAVAQKEALEASKVKSEFIANMSHEIRTPMNGIIGFTNLLLETELSSLQRNYLTTIQKSTLSLLNLVNNILDFSRLDAGQLRLEYVAFDIRDCIEDVLTILSPQANSKQLEFVALVDDDVPRKIISDPLRFKQIIINLASNAIKFTEKGEVIIHVTLEKKATKNTKLRVSIFDSGIGMSAKEQKLIFRAFQQADTSTARKYGGTGLGLAICKKLIDQMAGRIGLESEENKGSIFWFTFAAETAAPEMDDQSDTIPFINTKVYLYEPHSITRTMIKNVLAHWKIACNEFITIDSLLAELDNGPHFPTLLIAGVNQQFIQHSVALRDLSLIREKFSGPLIVLTNSSEQATLEYFLSAGATASLTKPIIRSNLYHTIFTLTQKPHEIQFIKRLPAPETAMSVQLIGKQILCVDDNVHNATLVSAFFANTMADITIVHDGSEAVRLAENHKFDLILMDLRMPKMDGIEALKRIRQTPTQNMNTPVIALSAHIAENEYKNLLAAGFNDFLTKPIIKDTLLHVVKRWLQPNALPNLQAEPTSQHSLFAATLIDNTMPIVDWNLSLKLAGNKQDLAKEMLAFLVKSLPTELNALRDEKDANNLYDLQQRVHKLHGAVCYCGLPRLKQALSTLESALKQNNTNDIETLFAQLENEIDHVLNYNFTTSL